MVFESPLTVSSKGMQQRTRFLRVEIRPIREICINRVSSFLAELPKASFQSSPIFGVQHSEDFDEIEDCE